MKKQIAVAMGLAVLSTSAFASKARLEALGQDANGSMYLDDARNVFLNPAQLNYHKDFVTLEFGSSEDSNTAARADADSAANPRAEGGMFKAEGNMVYGLYFGAESNEANSQRFLAMGGTDAVYEQNNLDFFIAGDAGVQWGVRLTYGSYENKQGTDNESSSIARGVLGIISGDLEGYANFGIENKAEGNNNTEFEGKGSVDLGVTYNMGDMDYIVQFATANSEDANGDKFTGQTVRLGAAKNYKLNDRANAWVSAFYVKREIDNEFAAIPSAQGESKDNYLPVTVALEVMAKEWLTLRGSVVHEVIGTNEDDAGDIETRANRTTIAAGASLTWGDLALDGMVGNTDGTTTGANTATGNGTLRTDQLLSRLSLTYKF